MPDGISYKPAADIQTQNDTTQDIIMAMGLWVFLMFMVLILQFNNIKYAIVIMTSVFLTISWSIYILAIFGYSFGFVAQLAIFWVLGVGVNQSLIHLEDFKYYYQKKWYSVKDSFRISIAERFIPIFLTKLTTIIWLVILAFKDELFGSLALAFIWWLIVSFFINLFYIPTLMVLVTRKYYDPDNINTPDLEDIDWDLTSDISDIEQEDVLYQKLSKPDSPNSLSSYDEQLPPDPVVLED